MPLQALLYADMTHTSTSALPWPQRQHFHWCCHSTSTLAWLMRMYLILVLIRFPPLSRRTPSFAASANACALHVFIALSIHSASAGGALHRFCEWCANLLSSVELPEAVAPNRSADLLCICCFCFCCCGVLIYLALPCACLANQRPVVVVSSVASFTFPHWSSLCSSCCGNAADCHWGACVAIQFDRLVRCWVTGATTLLNKSTQISAAAMRMHHEPQNVVCLMRLSVCKGINTFGIVSCCSVMLVVRGAVIDVRLDKHLIILWVNLIMSDELSLELFEM